MGGRRGKGACFILTEADPDDKVKIRGFLSWVEDFVFGFATSLRVVSGIHRYSGFFNCSACVMKANWKIARCPAESAERKYNRSRPNVITAFSDSSLTQAYKSFVSEKLSKTFLVITLLEIVPVLGLIAGVIYYRLRLVAPFLRYLTFGQSFLTKCYYGSFAWY